MVAPNIFACADPHTRMGDGGPRSCGEIGIGKRMRCWNSDISGMGGIFLPGQASVIHFVAGLEKGWGERPIHALRHYGPIAKEPWNPPCEPHIRPSVRWDATQAHRKHRFARD